MARFPVCGSAGRDAFGHGKDTSGAATCAGCVNATLPGDNGRVQKIKHVRRVYLTKMNKYINKISVVLQGQLCLGMVGYILAKAEVSQSVERPRPNPEVVVLHRLDLKSHRARFNAAPRKHRLLG